MEKIKKSCPLKAITAINNSNNFVCSSNCAWYDENINGCTMIKLTKALFDLVGCSNECNANLDLIRRAL